MFKHKKYLSIFIFVLLAVPLISSSTVAALTSEQIQALQSGIYYFDPGEADCSSSTTSVTLTGSDNIQKVWNFLIQQAGLSPDQAAGVMGNLSAQDGTFNPEQVQIPPGGNSTTPTTQKDLGWGLAQWTPTSGENPIIPAAQIAHVPPDQLDTLEGQLEVILSEMKTGTPPGVTDMIKILKQQTTVAGATQVFWQDFEGGGPNVPSSVVGYANSLLKQYGNSSSGQTGSTTTSNNSSGCNSQVSCSAGPSSSDLSTLRQTVICLAKQQEAIWASEPLTWRWTGYFTYESSNRSEYWCADFVSWVYKNAGDPFTNGLDGWDDPGVPGITEAPGFTYHPIGSKTPYTPVPGDIGIFYTNQAYGHTAIYLGDSGGTTIWIGGDQGPSPNGEFGTAESESLVDYGYNEPGSPGYLMGYVSPNGN